HESTIGSAYPVRGDPLQECQEAGKVCLSIVSSRRVRIDLDSLKPGPDTKLVLPPDELHIIRAAEKVSSVPKPSRNAAASRSYRIHRGRGCAPDNDGSRRFARK